MKKHKQFIPGQGVYGIYCIPLGRWYIGSGNLPSRLMSHRSQLRRGKHRGLPRLQWDWNEYGEAAFLFMVFVVPDEDDVRAYERHLIKTLDSLEHKNGYNKSYGRNWAPEARIRNVEEKLIRSRRFYRLPSLIHVEWPMLRSYIDNFVFDGPKLTESFAMNFDEEEWSPTEGSGQPDIEIM